MWCLFTTTPGAQVNTNNILYNRVPHATYKEYIIYLLYEAAQAESDRDSN